MREPPVKFKLETDCIYVALHVVTTHVHNHPFTQIPAPREAIRSDTAPNQSGPWYSYALRRADGGAGDQTADLTSTRPAVPPEPQLPWFSGVMCPFLATGRDCNIMMLRFLINQYITACSSSSERKNLRKYCSHFGQ